MATKLCTRPDAKDGKHKWTFVKNFKVGHQTISSRGSTVRLRVAGLYKCECGHSKEGRSNINAPGSSL